MGAPSKYTPELVAEICERLSKGEPLAQICRDEHMPDASTVWDWQKAREDVSQAIARAREIGEEVILAQCLGIADDNSQDVKEVDFGDGVIVQRTDHDVIQRAKLRIETRLKLLAKWNPKRWGEKVEVDNKGEVKHTINFKRG